MNSNYRRYILLLFVSGFFAFCGLVGCRNPTGDRAEKAENPKRVILHFSLSLDPAVYNQTKYGKPPQLAVWLEDTTGTKIRTVWVTEKTGTGNWGRRIVRPVSLPYWVSRWKIETRSDSSPNTENPAVAAVTGATPVQHINSEIRVPVNSVWNYYIEINVSGDYNDSFPPVLKDGRKDPNGNGQPSIIYRGRITALPGQRSVPGLIGRTDQLEGISHIIEDIEGISTAKDLLSKIEVTGKAFNSSK